MKLVFNFHKSDLIR